MRETAKRESAHRGNRRTVRRLVIVLAALIVMLASLIYMIHYESTRRWIIRANERYSALYAAPTLEPTSVPTPTAATERTSTPIPTSTPAPSPSPASMPAFAVAVDVTRAPLATPDANTLMYAMETPPPPQESFADLLALNPESVGFLTIEDVLTLPVVQRPNDNEFYLDHSFDLTESIAGTLFMDGSNLLVPEDDCLIIYGHNMRNGTMFRPLIQYENPDFLKQNPLAHFDTLYENRLYVPFAALTVTADPDSERYLNLRQLSFDEPGFNRFIKSLKALSIWTNPLEVKYGDRVLLLVTCEYTHDNGRFILALRAQRDDEAWDQLWAQVQESEMK